MRKQILVIAALAGLLLVGYPALSKDESGTTGENTRQAVFAGGCFWCTESDFEKIDGVLHAVSGYTGGHVDKPTYNQVSGGGTGHLEAVKVIYDPERTNYEDLLQVFWRSIDPTDAGGQFVDRGPQYRSAIFYSDAEQKKQAEASKKRLAASGIFDKPIVTEILPLKSFYEAEGYHQDYYKKNPIRYKWYRSGSGRDRFLNEVWSDRPLETKKNRMKSSEKTMGEENPAVSPGTNRRYGKPDDAALRRRLTPLQYDVTQNDATERPFQNQYWNNHQAGIYVDIVSGEPLFSSTDKFESGTGWPSFSRPLEPENIVEKTDRRFFTVRTEVRSKHADSHLGHVFADGPPPTGLRYCINSAALRFIPKDSLKERGYGRYAGLFEKHSQMTVKEDRP